MRGASARRIDLAIAIALGSGTFALFAALAPRTLELRDEGYLYVQSARAAAGELVHRDFTCIYGPGVYALTGWLYALFGAEILPVRLALAALRAASVAALYGVARHFAPRLDAGAAALLSLALGARVLWNLNTPYPAGFSLQLGILALFLLLRGLARRSGVLLFSAGLAAGCGVLFKQSLALMLGYGLALGLAAATALEVEASEPGERGSPRQNGVALALWSAAGALPLLPFAQRLSAWDYALHFLPLHALQLLLALRFRARGDARALWNALAPRLALFGAGAALAPLGVAAFYALQGALPALLQHMFVFPSELVHYDLPALAPGAQSVRLAAAVGCAGAAAIGLLRGRRAAGIAAAPAAWLAWELWRDPGAGFSDQVAGGLELLPALIALGAVAALAPRLLARGRRAEPALGAFSAALFFQIFLCFQIYPRAGFNLYLMLPLVPIALAWISLRARRFGAPRGSSRPRAIAAGACALLPLALLGGPGLAESLRELARRDVPATHFELPGLRGVAPPPDFYVREQLGAFRWLAEHLARLEPRDAPLALLGNQFLLHLVSPRADLFAGEAYYFHLFGWDMLPAEARARVQPEALLARLAAHPEAVVVTVDDFASARLRRALPELFAYVERHYRESYRVGLYRVWLRRPA